MEAYYEKEISYGGFACAVFDSGNLRLQFFG